jgi:hypothetical protein
VAPAARVTWYDLGSRNYSSRLSVITIFTRSQLSIAYLESSWCSAGWSCVLYYRQVGTSSGLELDFELSNWFWWENDIGLDIVTAEGDCLVEFSFEFDLVLGSGLPFLDGFYWLCGVSLCSTSSFCGLLSSLCSLLLFLGVFSSLCGFFCFLSLFSCGLGSC